MQLHKPLLLHSKNQYENTVVPKALTTTAVVLVLMPGALTESAIVLTGALAESTIVLTGALTESTIVLTGALTESTIVLNPGALTESTVARIQENIKAEEADPPVANRAVCLVVRSAK